MNTLTAKTLAVLTFLLLSMTVRADVPADATWIDVRTPGEYATGHVDGAASIPFDAIEVGIIGLKVDKDAPIYLYCAKGGRAEVAKQRLEALNYTNVTNVGGIDDARKLAATQPAAP